MGAGGGAAVVILIIIRIRFDWSNDGSNGNNDAPVIGVGRCRYRSAEGGEEARMQTMMKERARARHPGRSP